MILIFIIILIMMTFISFCYITWNMISKEKKQEYLTDRTVDLIDEVFTNFFDTLSSIGSGIATIAKAIFKAVRWVLRWYKALDNLIVDSPLIKCSKPLEIESLFVSKLNDIFDSPYYKQEKYELCQHHCKYVFSAVLIKKEMLASDIELKLVNRIVKLLKDYYPDWNVDFTYYVAVRYHEEIKEVHIYIASSEKGFDTIRNVNSRDEKAVNSDTFEESWEEYGS